MAVAAGLAIIAAAVYYRFSTPPPATPAAVTTDHSADSAPIVSATARRAQSNPRAPAASTAVPDRRADLNAPGHADYVQERKAELLDLTTSRDPSALPAILSELNNQDVEIRQAALSAVVQVGNKDAIPALQNQIAWAEDPREKVAIQDAIDFLRLPPADQIKNEAVAAQGAPQAQSPANN